MRWLARCLLFYVITCAPAVAEPKNIPTQITMIRAGWNADSFGIVTVAPTANPHGCPNPDGYVTDSSQPGYHTYYAATLLAFAERATVIVVVSDTECVGPFPKLIGIDIVR